MADLIENPTWTPGIYQLEEEDLVLGGAEGTDNVQAKQLANRTQFLKALCETLGAEKQPLDVTLTALASLVGAADKIPYFTGNDTAALTSLTAYVRTLLGAADAAAARNTLGAISQADLDALVNGAPGYLNQLNEFAAALGDDPNFAATVTNALALKASITSVQKSESNLAISAGTSDAITAAFTPAIAALTNGLMVCVKASTANGTATPTLKVDGTAALAIVKGANRALELGDIPGADYWGNYQYNQTLNKWVMLNPARGLSSGQVGEIFWVSKNKAPANSFKANGAMPSRAAYPELFAFLVKISPATISIASPGVVTWNGHDLSANDPVKFTTTGALPTGLVAGTTYYVVGASITTNTVQLSATPGGAAINTSGAQSGAHTAINAPFGDGDGSTTFTLPDMRDEFPRGWDDGRGGDLNRVFGSSQADELKSHAHANGFSAQTQAGSGGAYWAGAVATNTTSVGGTETRPRNVALLACIRY